MSSKIIGSKLLDVELVILDHAQNLRKTVRLSDLLGKEITCIITVPAAFTAVCSGTHLPSFISLKEELNKLACKVICISTDTINTLERWKKDFNGADHIFMASDCLGFFGRETGLVIPGHATLGAILNRSSIVIYQGQIKNLNAEKGTADCDISRGDKTLEDIRAVFNEKVKKADQDDGKVRLVNYPDSEDEIFHEAPIEE